MLTTVITLVVYSCLPIHGVVELGVALQLLVCVVAFLVVVGRQARAIVVADQPHLRAAEAVVAAIVVLIAMFGYVYLLLSAAEPVSFTEPLNRPDGVYIAVTVVATVGFGDIAPVSTMARMAVTVQMVLDLAVIGVIVRVLFGAAQRGMAKKSSAGEDANEVSEP